MTNQTLEMKKFVVDYSFVLHENIFVCLPFNKTLFGLVVMWIRHEKKSRSIFRTYLLVRGLSFNQL